MMEFNEIFFREKKKNLLDLAAVSTATHVATPHDDLWSLIKWDNW